MIKIIGICGKKQSGKSSVSRYLVYQGYYERPFAAPLKSAVMEMFQMTKDQVDGDSKEMIDKYWKVSPRYVMQKFGTEMMRETLVSCMPDLSWVKDDFWIRSMEKWYIDFHKRKPDIGIAIPDIRYINESNWVKKNGGEIWKIERPGLANEDSHKSENQNIKYDKLIVNDGTLEELDDKIMKAMNEKI